MTKVDNIILLSTSVFFCDLFTFVNIFLYIISFLSMKCSNIFLTDLPLYSERKKSTDEHEGAIEEHEDVDNDIILERRKILMIFKRSQKNMTMLILSYHCPFL